MAAIRRFAAGLVWGFLAFPVHAQSTVYPDKPIHFFVPSPPGGGTDSLSRLLADKIGELSKWTFVLDNKPGAGGNLGMDAMAKAPADGYSIAMGESANLAINPYLYRKMPYDAAKDVRAVALVGTVPLVLVVPATRPFDSVAALAAAARQQQLAFASSGNGTVGHLVGEMWARTAGVRLIHVPYKGAGPVMTDLIGGRVDLHFASLPAALALIKSGKLRALGVTSPQRQQTLPDVPTMAEAGYKDFSYHVFYGVVAPAGVTADIVGALNREVNRALLAPGMAASLADRGVESRTGTPEQFVAFLAAERTKFERAVKESGATVD